MRSHHRSLAQLNLPAEKNRAQGRSRTVCQEAGARSQTPAYVAQVTFRNFALIPETSGTGRKERVEDPAENPAKALSCECFRFEVALIHQNIANNESDQQCTFTQTDNVIACSCKSAEGKVLPVTGSIDGAKVTWKYDSDFNGTLLMLTNTATLDDSAGLREMSRSCRSGSRASLRRLR